MWIAITFITIVFLIIPIAGILTWHSQEMAKVKAKNGPATQPDELALIKREMTELRQMITSLAINVENMKDNYVHVSALEDRMRVGE